RLMLSRGTSSDRQFALPGSSVSPLMLAIHNFDVPVASSLGHTPHACDCDYPTSCFTNMRKNPRRSGCVTSRSSASCTASFWIDAMHSARMRSSRSAPSSALSREISSAGEISCGGAARCSGSAKVDMHRLSATRAVRSPPQRDDAGIVLLADARVIYTDDPPHVRTGDGRVGTLPDCLSPGGPPFYAACSSDFSPHCC